MLGGIAPAKSGFEAALAIDPRSCLILLLRQRNANEDPAGSLRSWTAHVLES